MTFIKNLGLFCLVFFPVATLASMGIQAIQGWEDIAPAWRVGWNPIIWLILTVPWLLPTLVIVPLLQLLASRLRRSRARKATRRTLMLATPVLALVVQLLFFGGNYLKPENWLIVVIGGLAYGAVMRIPGDH